LSKILRGADAIIEECQRTIEERNIMRKSMGPRVESNIMHTKVKPKPNDMKGNPIPNEPGGSVFHYRGNQSGIGKCAKQEISKGAVQSHPGKATKNQKDLKFCNFCGIYVTSEVYTL
jgi:hypothetical protein